MFVPLFLCTLKGKSERLLCVCCTCAWLVFCESENPAVLNTGLSDKSLGKVREKFVEVKVKRGKS